MSNKSASRKLIEYLWFTLRTLNLPLYLRSVRYSLEKTYADLKYADLMHEAKAPELLWETLKKSRDPRPTPPPFNTFNKPGAVQSWKQVENALTVNCNTMFIQLVAVTPHIIQVRMKSQDIFNKPLSYALLPSVSEWPKPKVTVRDNTSTLLFETGSLTVQINRHTSHLDFLDPSGLPINLDSGGLGWSQNWVGTERSLSPYSPVFGLGERAAPLNLRGGSYQMWNRDPGGQYSEGDDPLYQTHPWFISFNRNRAFGMFFDNTHDGYLDLGQTKADHYCYTAANGELRYYFIYGPSVRNILTRLSELTGHIDLPPLWSLGLHQSRWSYKTAKTVKNIALEFRKRRIPCDVIHLDIHHMQNYQVFTWHKRRFPKPDKLIKDLRASNFRLVSIVDPGIKADKLNDLAEKGIKENVFLKYPDGKLFQGPVWPGDCYFPDFTSPAVRIWWGSQIQALVKVGIAGLWTDMNEPAIFSAGDGTIPDSVQHAFEGKQATHAEMHNVYGMQMARATQKALAALRPKKRPFVLSRAGFSGIQRYAAVWTGDNESTWEHLRLSLNMTLNLGLSGVPFAGPDIGGFSGIPDPELFARWIQLGTLLPLSRIHTADFTPAQEPWSYGETIEKIAREAIERRYQLLPYIYTAFWQANQIGLPVARPLFIDFQDDSYTYSLDDQFMLGDSLLVAPILTANTTERSVYLPQGTDWFNYWTGEHLLGGQSIPVQAPLSRLPLFIKAGCVLPQWPLIQHTDEAKTLQQIELQLFAGLGQSELYQDEEDGLRYQDGYYKHTRFVCRLTSNQLILTTRERGDYTPSHDIIIWTIHTPQPISPTSILADGLAITDWNTQPFANSITFRTPIIHRLEIQFGS